MNHHVKGIYEQLCGSYPLQLNRSVDLYPRWTVEFPVLCGTSALGDFEMFFDDVSFAFYVERDGQLCSHWHLQTPEEAKQAVIAFMEGRAKR